MKKCSICRQEGHNAATCPQQPRNHVVWGKVDNLTEREAGRLQKKIEDSKRCVAQEGRGVFFHDTKERLLPRIAKILGFDRNQADS